MKNFAYCDTTLTITATDMHTGGEPLRIISRGMPLLPNASVLEQRRHLMTNHDHIRKALMLEPRGHSGMYGAVIVPCSPECDLGVLFLHTAGYSVMCGHGVIALGRYAVDHGIVAGVSPETKVKIECPCGPVTCFVDYKQGKSGAVRFQSVPTFVVHLDFPVTFKGTEITVDISFGGTFYVLVDCRKLQLRLDDLSEVVSAANELLTNLRRSQLTLTHPTSPDLCFLYGCIVTDGPKNICVFGEQQVDRCPTGSGVTARMALAWRKGEVKLGDKELFISGVNGSEMTGSVVREEETGVIVEVSGRAFYTGKTDFIVEKGDELGYGFKCQ